MRYVCMHKTDAECESGALPPQQLIKEMGELIGTTAHAGKFLDGGGLRPSAHRFRLTFARGQCTVTKGPLTGHNELPAAFVIIKVATEAEGLDWTRRFGLAAGAEEIELGPLTEPWDLGICPKPPGALPLKLMIVLKATRDSEAGRPPAPAGGHVQAGGRAQIEKEMAAAGVLVSVINLQPSAKAVRLRYRNNDRTVLDGPFSESKELIGGYSMVQMGSLDEVLEWSDRFARIVGGTCEIDVREVAEARTAAPRPR